MVKVKRDIRVLGNRGWNASIHLQRIDTIQLFNSTNTTILYSCLYLDTCVGGRGCPPIVLLEQRVHDPQVFQVGPQARDENHQKEQERHVL